MSQSTKAEIDKDQYKEIQIVIEQNPSITGFDLYYLGFLSYYASQLSLKSTFTHVRNINNLHVDDLITSEEKIEFLLRIVSKLVDFSVIKPVTTTSEDTDVEAETKRILGDYFSQILKLIPKYGNISRFELFYLGRFHAICPNYKIAELFHHINNINMLVYGDLIDEDIQVDFLLKILNKKIKTHQGKETTLNIPTDQDIDKKEGSVPNVFLIKNEDAESKADKPDKSPPLFVKKEDSATKQNPPASSKPAEKSSKTASEKSKESRTTKENQSTSSKETESKQRGRKSKGDFDQDRESDNMTEKQSRSKTPLDSAENSKGVSNQEPWRKNSPVDKATTKASSSGKGTEGNNKFKFSTEKPAKDGSRTPPRSPNNYYQGAGDSLLSLAAENKRLSNIRKGVSLAGAYLMKEDSNPNNKTIKTPTIRSGSVSKENSRRIEEEPFPRSDSGENSKSNESTSVESSEVKAAKQVSKSKVITNVAVNSAISIASVGGGADSMNIESHRTFHSIGGSGEHHGEESPSKKKVQTKPKLTGVEELLRRVRAEDSEETTVEKRKSTKASEMLPPASGRESQASVGSERPLLVDWKKKNVKKLREERSESEQEEEEKSGSEQEESEEEETVELGKRGKKVLKGTEETKKKVKNEKNMQRDPKKTEVESYEEKRKRVEKGGKMVEETRKGHSKVVEEDEENEESGNSQETKRSLKQIKSSQKSKGKQQEETTPVKKSARMKKVPEKRARTRSPSSDGESME